MNKVCTQFTHKKRDTNGPSRDKKMFKFTPRKRNAKI